jgi:O-antigen ligase
MLARLTGLGDLADDPMQASAGRTLLWQIAFDKWLHAPVFGAGWGAYRLSVGSATHNEFLMFLVDTGLVGFLLYAFVWLQVLTLVRRVRKAGYGDAMLLAAFHSAVVTAMIAIFFVNLHKAGLFMWSILGLVTGYCCQLLWQHNVATSKRHQAKVVEHRVRPLVVAGNAGDRIALTGWQSELPPHTGQHPGGQ